MKQQGILIVTENNQRARKFYEELFGLKVIKDNDGNMVLEGNIYLQEKNIGRSF